MTEKEVMKIRMADDKVPGADRVPFTIIVCSSLMTK